MSIFLRIPTTSICQKYHYAGTPRLIQYAAYSVHSVHRKQSPLLHRPTSSLIQARNSSFSATVAAIYSDLSNSYTVHVLQQNLINIHDWSGLPWWFTIICSTILLRSIITFPLAVYNNKITARLHLLTTVEMPELVKELKMEANVAMQKFNWTEQQTRRVYNRSLRKQYNKLIQRDNCHPLKTTIVLWFQIPLWICQSVAIRNLITMLPDPTSYDAQLAFIQLTVGGFAWIPNLIETDTSGILPVLMCLLNLANVEVHALEKAGRNTKLQTYVTVFFRLVSVAFVPIAASVPSCLALYWCTSSAFGLAQSLILLSPKTKRILRIPLNTQYHMEHPYRTLAERFVEQMHARKNWMTSLVVTNRKI